MKPAPLSLLICYTTQQYSIGVMSCGPGFCLQVLGGPSTSSSVLPHTCVCQHQSQGGKLLQNVCNCPAHSPSARVHRLPTIGSTEHVKKCVAWTLSAELLPKRLARPSQAGHHSSSAFNRTCRLCISRAASEIIYHIANAAHTHTRGPVTTSHSLTIMQCGHAFGVLPATLLLSLCHVPLHVAIVAEASSQRPLEMPCSGALACVAAT